MYEEMYILWQSVYKVAIIIEYFQLVQGIVPHIINLEILCSSGTLFLWLYRSSGMQVMQLPSDLSIIIIILTYQIICQLWTIKCW